MRSVFIWKATWTQVTPWIFSFAAVVEAVWTCKTTHCSNCSAEECWCRTHRHQLYVQQTEVVSIAAGRNRWNKSVLKWRLTPHDNYNYTPDYFQQHLPGHGEIQSASLFSQDDAGGLSLPSFTEWPEALGWVNVSRSAVKQKKRTGVETRWCFLLTGSHFLYAWGQEFTVFCHTGMDGCRTSGVTAWLFR